MEKDFDGVVKAACFIYFIVMVCLLFTTMVFCIPYQRPTGINELGDFLAGAFSPLAFGYFYLSYKAQLNEMKATVRQMIKQNVMQKNEKLYPYINSELSNIASSIISFVEKEFHLRDINYFSKNTNYFEKSIDSSEVIENLIGSCNAIISRQVHLSKLDIASQRNEHKDVNVRNDIINIHLNNDFEDCKEKIYKYVQDKKKFISSAWEFNQNINIFCNRYEVERDKFDLEFDDLHASKIRNDFKVLYEQMKLIRADCQKYQYEYFKEIEIEIDSHFNVYKRKVSEVFEELMSEFR